MNIIGIILLCILAILAPYGGYLVAILAVQSLKKIEFEPARLYINEIIKDFQFSRSEFWLHQTVFPSLLRNDIAAYLNDQEYERWWKRFNMASRKMEDWGINSIRLPFYRFVLLCESEDSSSVYESMIRELCKYVLNIGNCTELRVCIEWSESMEKNYKVCTIIYSRTAKEQQTFLKYLSQSEQRKIGHVSGSIIDPELEKDISNYTGEQTNG